MKKVISITLGGIVFSIEEEAYKSLSVYLEAIKQNLLGNDDYNEIVEDVETAIAEKFTTRKRNEKMAVTHTDVEMVTLEMGLPSDFADGAEEDAGGTNATTSTTEPTDETKKRLYRDTDNSIIAGVASGLARYFDIDPVIVRLIFVVSIFFNGLGILAYIILWLVVPAAETTTQKYAMRGEKVTLNQISERVKKKINEIDTEKIKTGAQNSWGGVRPFLVKLFEVLGILIRFVVGLLRYIIGFAFLIGGALGIAGLVSASSVLWIAESRWVNPEFKAVTDIILADASGYVFITALLVSAFIPLLIIIMAGGSLVSGRNLFTITKSIVLGVIWIVSITLVSSFGIMLGPTFMNDVRHVETYFDDGDVRFFGMWHHGRGDYWKEEYKNADTDSIEFKRQLEEAVRIEIGQPIEGYEPFMFMQVFPGLEESDFDEVEALIGHYEYNDGELKHELGNVNLVHSAAGAVSTEGIETLLENVVERLGLEPGDFELEEVITELKGDTIVQPLPLPPDNPVACTADAKICPDGTGVGRIGPNCEFAACPSEVESITCTEEMKNADACIEIYAPVCGLVDVQCITTPCPPVPETFSNGCFACAQGNVSSYTEGECSI